jgi:hypothetical protein
MKDQCIFYEVCGEQSTPNSPDSSPRAGVDCLDAQAGADAVPTQEIWPGDRGPAVAVLDGSAALAGVFTSGFA